MSDSETKRGYNTNPLDKKVAERAEEEMGEAPSPGVDSEAPTREMSQGPVPVAGGPTQEIAGTAPWVPGNTSPVTGTPSGPFGAPASSVPPPIGEPRPYAPPPPPPAYQHPVQGQWPQQYPPQTGPYPAHQTGPVYNGVRTEGSASLGLKPNFAAMAAYTPFIGFVASLLLVLTEPQRNRFVRFHAKQALIGHVVFWTLATALSLGARYAPGPISFLLMFPRIGIYLAYLIGFIFMMSKAYNGERHKIPIIGDQAD